MLAVWAGEVDCLKRTRVTFASIQNGRLRDGHGISDEVSKQTRN
jgi:hypothetical protein